MTKQKRKNVIENAQIDLKRSSVIQANADGYQVGLTGGADTVPDYPGQALCRWAWMEGLRRGTKDRLVSQGVVRTDDGRDQRKDGQVG